MDEREGPQQAAGLAPFRKEQQDCVDRPHHWPLLRSAAPDHSDTACRPHLGTDSVNTAYSFGVTGEIQDKDPSVAVLTACFGLSAEQKHGNGDFSANHLGAWHCCVSCRPPRERGHTLSARSAPPKASQGLVAKMPFSRKRGPCCWASCERSMNVGNAVHDWEGHCPGPQRPRPVRGSGVMQRWLSDKGRGPAAGTVPALHAPRKHLGAEPCHALRHLHTSRPCTPALLPMNALVNLHCLWTVTYRQKSALTAPAR